MSTNEPDAPPSPCHCCRDLRAELARTREWLKLIADWKLIWSGQVVPVQSVKRMAIAALHGDRAPHRGDKNDE